MKCVLLATAPVPVIRLAVAQIRRHFAGARIVVYLRDALRSELEPELGDFELRSDRTRGRLLQLVRSLRAECFDHVFVIFPGGPDHWKLKLVSFLAGGKRLTVFNESGDFFDWDRQNLGTIRQHLQWRLRAYGGPEPTIPALDPALAVLTKIYSCTLGPLLGLIYLTGHVMYLEVRRARFKP